MTADQYSHPPHVEINRVLGITLSSEDTGRVFQIMRSQYEKGIEAGAIAERKRAAEYLDRNLMSARDYAVVIANGNYE